jgi:hypothetical protein
MPDDRPSTLIESWFPFATVGAEKPINTVRKGWARRSLTGRRTSSRGA